MKYAELTEKAKKAIKKKNKASTKKLKELYGFLLEKQEKYQNKIIEELKPSKKDKIEIKLKVVNKQLDKISELLGLEVADENSDAKKTESKTALAENLETLIEKLETPAENLEETTETPKVENDKVF